MLIGAAGGRMRPRRGLGPWLGGFTLASLVMLVLVAAATAQPGFARVKVASANLRAGPGTTHQRLWLLSENYPLRVVGRRGRWLKTVDFEGYEGWIFAPLTDTQPAVVVQVARANLRAGPGTTYRRLSTEVAGIAFRVLGRKGEWLRVEHADGGRGWIHRSLVWGSWKRRSSARR